jgi:hypothetical protein
LERGGRVGSAVAEQNGDTAFGGREREPGHNPVGALEKSRRFSARLPLKIKKIANRSIVSNNLHDVD